MVNARCANPGLFSDEIGRSLVGVVLRSRGRPRYKTDVAALFGELHGQSGIAACEFRDIIEQFNRLAERYDGEAMASITKPHPRREEYSCSACNMDIVPDIYNRLHSRDAVVHCPSCRRMLFIPDDLPPELAINKGGASGKPATTRVRRKTKTEAANKGNISTPPVLSKWDELVTRAQGESVRAAVEADHAPVVARVEINGEMVGEFKGKTLDHLARCISLVLSENGFTADVKVTSAATTVVEPAPVVDAATAPAVDATSPQSDAVVDAPASPQS